MKCPKCYQANAIHTSDQRGFEQLLSIFNIAAYRCWNCYHRFLGLRRCLESDFSMQIRLYGGRLLRAAR